MLKKKNRKALMVIRLFFVQGILRSFLGVSITLRGLTNEEIEAYRG
jgi:hypothetical protein